MAVNLKSLIGRLNDQTRGALEGAAGLCLSRTHYNIEIEHYLTKLLDTTDTDLQRILNHFGVDPSRLTTELSRGLDGLKTGNARNPAFSPSLVNMFTEGWTIGSIDYGATQVRSGFTIIALTANDELARLMRETSREFQKIEPEVLRKEFSGIVSGTQEDTAAAASETAAAPGEPRPGGKTPNLDQFTFNLTDNARQGKIDPVL
ncbi:MAG: type VI secretion system ATPase TssH, partial [bacterium]|nr:type VI secretion system ATPase TssH [bacterium]